MSMTKKTSALLKRRERDPMNTLVVLYSLAFRKPRLRSFHGVPLLPGFSHNLDVIKLGVPWSPMRQGTTSFTSPRFRENPGRRGTTWSANLEVWLSWIQARDDPRLHHVSASSLFRRADVFFEKDIRVFNFLLAGWMKEGTFDFLLSTRTYDDIFQTRFRQHLCWYTASANPLREIWYRLLWPTAVFPIDFCFKQVPFVCVLVR